MRIGLAVVFAVMALATAPASAQQRETVTIPSVGPGGVAQLPAAADLRRTCYLAEVAAFENRVHLKCVPPSRGGLYTQNYVPPPEEAFSYFAVSTTADPALASRVIELGVAASGQNKQVQILFRTNPAENPPGCLVADCRRLTGLILIVR